MKMWKRDNFYKKMKKTYIGRNGDVDDPDSHVTKEEGIEVTNDLMITGMLTRVVMNK